MNNQVRELSSARARKRSHSKWKDNAIKPTADSGHALFFDAFPGDRAPKTTRNEMTFSQVNVGQSHINCFVTVWSLHVQQGHCNLLGTVTLFSSGCQAWDLAERSVGE